MVEAAGIEPDPACFKKRRRRATFGANPLNGGRLRETRSTRQSPTLPLSPPLSWRDSGKRRERIPGCASTAALSHIGLDGSPLESLRNGHSSAPGPI